MTQHPSLAALLPLIKAGKLVPLGDDGVYVALKARLELPAAVPRCRIYCPPNCSVGQGEGAVTVFLSEGAYSLVCAGAVLVQHLREPQ